VFLSHQTSGAPTRFYHGRGAHHEQEVVLIIPGDDQPAGRDLYRKSKRPPHVKAGRNTQCQEKGTPYKNSASSTSSRGGPKGEAHK